MPERPAQFDTPSAAARPLETGGDPDRFDEPVRTLAKPKSLPERPE